MNPEARDNPARVAMAVSGSGRSLANFLAKPQAEYQVAAVIASRPDCRAVDLARAHDLALYIDEFSANSNSDMLTAWLATQRIDWIVLAGFIKLFPVLPQWRQRLVNIHPALLPHFGGKGMYGDRVHAAVLAAGARETGATVHYVDERYDEGAAISQIVVPVLPSDDTRRLADRVFAAECKLYPETLRRLVLGTLPRADGAVERLVHDDF